MSDGNGGRSMSSGIGELIAAGLAVISIIVNIGAISWWGSSQTTKTESNTVRLDKLEEKRELDVALNSRQDALIATLVAQYGALQSSVDKIAAKVEAK